MGVEQALNLKKNNLGEIRLCPIVECTAFSQSSEVDRCKVSGMDEFVTKPFRIDVIN